MIERHEVWRCSWILAVFFCLTVAVATFARGQCCDIPQGTNENHVSAGTTAPIEKDERWILAKLAEPVFFDMKKATTLGAVLKEIQAETGIEIDVDWNALKEKGITPETPVKFRLPLQMPLKDAMQYIEQQVGMTWTIKDRALAISPSRARNDFYVDSYYIADLLPRSKPQPEEAKESYESDKKIQKNQARFLEIDPKDFVPLVDYIKVMVDAKSWENVAEIVVYHANLSLVIRQTERGHRDIAELLGRLRKYRDVQAASNTNVSESAEKEQPRNRAAFSHELSRKLDRKDYFRRTYNVSDLNGRAETASLVDLIQNVVDPSTWKDEATIKPEGDNLVIRQTTAVHTEVAYLLDQLRELNRTWK